MEGEVAISVVNHEPQHQFAEFIDWLADNSVHTKRFAFFVGRRYRDRAINAVAEDRYLDWHPVKELDKQYMPEQPGRASQPNPIVHHERHLPEVTLQPVIRCDGYEAQGRSERERKKAELSANGNPRRPQKRLLLQSRLRQTRNLP